MTEPDWTKLEEDIENERCERERKLDEASTRLVLNDMLAAIAAKCVQADEAEKQSRLENFYAGML